MLYIFTVSIGLVTVAGIALLVTAAIGTIKKYFLTDPRAHVQDGSNHGWLLLKPRFHYRRDDREDGQVGVGGEHRAASRSQVVPCPVDGARQQIVPVDAILANLIYPRHLPGNLAEVFIGDYRRTRLQRQRFLHAPHAVGYATLDRPFHVRSHDGFAFGKR